MLIPDWSFTAQLSPEDVKKFDEWVEACYAAMAKSLWFWAW